jgi:hypothetical protein
VAQVLRHERVLERPEDGRQHTHEKDHGQQRRYVAQVERHGAQAHQEYFDEPRLPDQAAFFVFVGQLPRQGRKQEEGQDEQALGGIRHHAGVICRRGNAEGQ